MEKTPLRDAFTQRGNRFFLLDKGMKNAGFTETLELLEIGCAGGEAAKHLSVKGFTKLTAIDIDGAVLERARERAPGCRFICADACALPFADESFDGLFSEAAFAVIPDKAAAAAEYARILRSGGRFLLNDFALRKPTAAERRDIQGIPCLEGVQTAADYIEIFQSVGLRTVYQKEEYLRVFRALSDENRIKILEKLSEGEQCACCLLEGLGISQSTLSHHMKILCESGLVRGERVGVWMYYSIDGEGCRHAGTLLNSLANGDMKRWLKFFKIIARIIKPFAKKEPEAEADNSHCCCDGAAAEKC